jgi:NitT/TauT family transport system substrate-binding protein
MKPTQLRVFRYDDEGVATLEDGLYALSSQLGDPAMRDRLARFLRATVAGWRFAVAPGNQDEAVRIVLRHATADAPASNPKEAKRMLREVAKLVAGNRHGIGHLDPAAYERTVDVLLSSSASPVIRRRPEGAWTHAVWERAFMR